MARTTELVSEYRGARLGDQRLTARLCRIVQSLELAPDLGFPRAMGSEGELEGFYRFVGNERVTLEEVTRPHRQATVERLRREPEALVLHDTTDFHFRGEAARAGLGPINVTDQGFLGHFALAISADGQRRALGVLGVETWTRQDPGPTRLRRGGLPYVQCRALPSEAERWPRLVDAVIAEVGAATSLIHVMDSEADDYRLLSCLVEKGQRWVVRFRYDRVLATELLPPDAPRKTRAFVARREVVCRRTVTLAKRRAGTRRPQRRTLPREQREAQLEFRSARVVLPRPAHCAEGAPTLTVNVVAVTETGAPPEVEPVAWLLVTSEPIDSEEEILRVVDYYRARWVIEEYFKALKTGCAFEKRQLESGEALRRALGIFIPIAWQLLRLRGLCRHAPAAPAEQLLTTVQVEVLRRDRRCHVAAQPTVREAFLAIARLGGHLRSNGEPGWQVLGRGYVELLTLEAGFRLALTPGCDQ